MERPQQSHQAGRLLGSVAGGSERVCGDRARGRSGKERRYGPERVRLGELHLTRYVSPAVAALALLVWDILTTMDEEVRVPGGERIDGRLTDSSCQGEADLAVRPSSLFKYDLSSCPLRSSWTVPKFLYFFVRYYSLITLMCVRTKHVQRARL